MTTNLRVDTMTLYGNRDFLAATHFCRIFGWNNLSLFSLMDSQNKNNVNNKGNILLLRANSLVYLELKYWGKKPSVIWSTSSDCCCLPVWPVYRPPYDSLRPGNPPLPQWTACCGVNPLPALARSFCTLPRALRENMPLQVVSQSVARSKWWHITLMVSRVLKCLSNRESCGGRCACRF